MRAERLELLELLEIKRRRLAIADLNAYCRTVEIPGAPLLEDDPECEEFYPDTVEPAAHHKLINKTLMAVEEGKMPRCMIFMPPGSAKSTYASVVFPTWFMGRQPRRSVICTSYGSTLASRFGRKCRQITRSKIYKDLFNAELVSDNRAADDWSLTNESTYMAAGILAGVTGNRADGLVIDDPVKGRADADSPTIRAKVWDAYLNDLRTRLKPGAFILLIQTRWHEDDLAGRILPADWNGRSGWVTAKDGEPWFVLCLQAECEREDDPLGRKVGEWLWTDWFTPEHWAQEKRSQGSRNWQALYQQRPMPPDGALVKFSWLRRYTTPPAEFVRVVQSWDTAYKPQQHNDPSVCTTWGETRHGYYLLHVWRNRVEYPALKRAAVSLYQRWKPHAVLIEDKGSGTSLIQELRSGTALPVIGLDPMGVNKIDRLVAVSPRIEAGLVFLPHAADWLIDFEAELCAFPLGTNDDQVDSTSQFIAWAHRYSQRVEHYSTGTTRAGLAEHATAPEDERDDIYSVPSINDFGGH